MFKLLTNQHKSGTPYDTPMKNYLNHSLNDFKRHPLILYHEDLEPIVVGYYIVPVNMTL